ncbi:FAD-binding oxidoreductase [Pelomicrobium sp. G1]|uniref:FAD-binding oxidoreductase n=1 Tax=unclassified Pelomicrobium TaxID=2815318 RepID=UPI003F7757EF
MNGATHAAKVERLRALLASRQGPVGLAKGTSNLFRDRREQAKQRLDVADFDTVLRVDPAAGLIEAEGMVTYERLTDAALACGMMPAVVPQLKSITLGGAVAGVGIESSAFLYGLVHETVEELEVLTGDRRVVIARRDNEHRDLFYGFPNSYGTLGYALRLKVKAVPVKPYVRLEHRRFGDARRFFEALEGECHGDADFIDGVVFGRDELVLTLGRFVDQAPYASDYRFERIYYRSLRSRPEDYLTVRDYLWRWDTDWFWCSKNLGAQNPLLRRFVFGPSRLNSVTYTRIMRWNARWGLTRVLNRVMGWHTESVIQDVDIPLSRCAEFLDFFLGEIGILPVWICPIRVHSGDYALYPMRPGQLYVNFGFWDVVRRREAFPAGYHNRLIEKKVQALGGIKSLYSESYFTEDEFWRIYGGEAYHRLKTRYDPEGAFPDLYQKCVLGR